MVQESTAETNVDAPVDEGLIVPMVAERMATAVWVLDLDAFGFRWCNPAALTVLGLAHLDELERWRTDQRQPLQETLAAALIGVETGTSIVRELPLPSRRGTLSASCAITPVPLPDGHRGAVVELGTQISDEQARGLEALAALPLGIAWFSADGHALGGNLTARQWFSQPDTGLVQRFVQLKDGQRFLVRMLTDGAISGEFDLRFHSGPATCRVSGRVGRDPLTHAPLIVVSIWPATPTAQAMVAVPDASPAPTDELHTIQRALDRLTREQAIVFDNPVVGIMFVRARRIAHCNRRFEAMFGYSAGGLDAKPTLVLYPSKESWETLWHAGHAVLARGEAFRAEIELRHRSGKPMWCDMISRAVDPDDVESGAIWIAVDITERKRVESALKNAHEELERRVRERTRELQRSVQSLQQEITERRQSEEHARHLAHHDTLTGLPNRTLLEERLTFALSRATETNGMVALMFIDLDRFKTINDSLGHLAGDQLLQAVGQRLRGCIQGRDTVARQGGDEFVVVLGEIHDEEQVRQVAERIYHRLAEPFRIDRMELHVTPSIGIALYPRDGEDVLALMKSADTAMYQAKEAGRANFQFFNPEMTDVAVRRWTLENHLRGALKNNELELFFQPRVNVANQSICGAEILLRWRHPELGLVGPDTFIPIAEESGLINTLGEWVLERTCAQWVEWRERGMPLLTLSVNLSAQQFRRPQLVADIARILDSSGMPADRLELELTESMLMRHADNVVSMLNALNDMGIRLSVDDFGTGYSNLAYLKRFPIDNLKIDRSFVRDIPADADDTVIAETIIAMGRSLNLRVVAEGVETADQLAWLVNAGCHEYQGFYHSHPMPAAEFEALFIRPQSSR